METNKDCEFCKAIINGTYDFLCEKLPDANIIVNVDRPDNECATLKGRFSCIGLASMLGRLIEHSPDLFFNALCKALQRHDGLKVDTPSGRVSIIVGQK